MCYSEKMFRLTILAYFLHILHCSTASMVTSIPVVMPEPVMEDMADVYERMDVYRLNDRLKGLTALKDKKYMSCFVNDYDPYWQPAPGDKQYIVQSKPCEKVDLNIDFESLKQKAGENIAKMCRELFVFWLSSQNMPPPPLFDGSSSDEKRSCPIDTEIPALVLNEGIGSNARHGSAANGYIVNGEQKPPMSGQGQYGDLPPNDAPPMLNMQPPLGEGHAGAPPMMQGGAPPMMQGGAPPMMQGGAPPMMQGGAPPMLRGNNMPPPLEGGDMKAPPMFGAPPMIRTPPPLNLLAALTQGQQSRRNAPPGPDVMLRILSGDYATPTPDMRTPPPPPTQFWRND